MKHTDPKQYLAAAHRAVAYGGAIEWEELPSLAEQLPRQQAERAPGEAAADLAAADPNRRVWDDTEPSAFDAFPDSTPQTLHEPFEGLGVREVSSQQVFQHFFGPGARR